MVSEKCTPWLHTLYWATRLRIKLVPIDDSCREYGNKESALCFILQSYVKLFWYYQVWYRKLKTLKSLDTFSFKRTWKCVQTLEFIIDTSLGKIDVVLLLIFSKYVSLNLKKQALTWGLTDMFGKIALTSDTVTKSQLAFTQGGNTQESCYCKSKIKLFLKVIFNLTK